MTKAITHRKNAPGWREEILSILLLIMTLSFGLTLSGEASAYVKDGMRLAVGCVIPSSFPFMIISDLYSAYGHPENIRLFADILSGVLGIPKQGIGAFICGNVGGFPIGAKMCAEGYESGAISKAEAERLIPLCSNPSSAFIIGGVGIGMFNDLKVGFILLASVALSTLVCGMITKIKTDKSYFSNNKIRQNYSFVDSVKKAGTSCIGIISFISVFSVALGIIKKRVKYKPLLYAILAFSEVTNAVDSLAKSDMIPMGIRLTVCAFSLGFGGLCVGMQSAYFATGAGLSMRKYYAVKLLSGILSSCIATLIFLLLK
jgi:sporulation integral membrane protein YlbJ